MNEQFHGNWSSMEDMVRSFDSLYDWRDGDADKVQDSLNTTYAGVEVLFAAYEYADYSGGAFVLFRRNGVLYEVNGGHCSCYGLEGQWDPEETSKDAILHRMEHANYGMIFVYAAKIREILEVA